MNKKILIIDDDFDIAELAGLVLQTVNYEAKVCIDPMVAINVAREFKPDAILLDLNMPRMDGWAVFKIIRKDASFKDVPIAILTAKSQQFDEMVGLHIMHADAYITKPFGKQELIDDVTELLVKASPVKDICDEMKLFNIALHSDDLIARIAAIKKINNLMNIFEIANCRNVYLVCMAALRKITTLFGNLIEELQDQNIVEDIAMNGNLSLVAIPEINNVSVEYAYNEIMKINSHLYLEIIIENQKRLLRKTAVKAIKNQQTLATIVEKVAIEEIQITSVNCIDNQKLLSNIIFKNNKLSVCIAAVKRIEDENELARIVLEKEEAVSKVAIYNINKKLLLNEIVRTSKYTSVRLVAIKKISNQKLLSIIASSDPEKDVRVAAIEKLISQKTLTKCAQNDPSSEARVRAIRKIVNKDDLARIAQNEKEDMSVRTQAILRIIEMLSDSMLLLDYARFYKNSEIGLKAWDKITDQSTLIEIAKNDRDLQTRITAVGKINDKTALLNIAENKEDLIQDAVVERLKRIGEREQAKEFWRSTEEKIV